MAKLSDRVLQRNLSSRTSCSVKGSDRSSRLRKVSMQIQAKFVNICRTFFFKTKNCIFIQCW